MHNEPSIAAGFPEAFSMAPDACARAVCIGVAIVEGALKYSVGETDEGSLANNEIGIANLVTICRRHSDCCVFCEATGLGQPTFIRSLFAAGIRVRLVHPDKVRLHARHNGLTLPDGPIQADALRMFGHDATPFRTNMTFVPLTPLTSLVKISIPRANCWLNWTKFPNVSKPHTASSIASMLLCDRALYNPCPIRRAKLY